MERSLFSTTVSTLTQFAGDHAPEILTGVGIGGMVTASVLAVRATPKACESMKEEKKRLSKTKLSVFETIKATWKQYWFPTLLGGASIACLIGSNSVSNRRNAALATVAAASETALKTYTEKVKEVLGEKKEKEVQQAVAQKHVDDNPVDDDVIRTGKGNTPCILTWDNTRFYSDRDKIMVAVAELNTRMACEGEVTYNEFRYALNLNSVDSGDELSWKIENGLIDPSYTSHLDPNGVPMLAITFKPNNQPKSRYLR